MSIADGLRRYAANWDGFFYDDEDGGLINAIGYVPARSTPVPNVINAIADSIDKQHAEERDKAYAEGVYDGIDADKNTMGYIKLPVDDDGVPIRIGDTMEWLDGSTAEVIGVGNGVFFYKDDESDGADWSSSENKHHVKPDSWESIIQDAVKLGYADYPTTGYEAELVERCKRLAGE